MKKTFISIIIIIVGWITLSGIVGLKTPNSEFLRIHIRANSNSEVDQNIKYLIKDAVVDAMIPLLSDCTSKKEAESVLSKNLFLVDKVSNDILSKKGFSYEAKARLANEEFPTRVYDDFVLEKGFYDALIIDLGEGQGDNWWCVVYPPLCFLKTNPTGEGVVYKSKLIEIIKSFFS